MSGLDLYQYYFDVEYSKQNLEGGNMDKTKIDSKMREQLEKPFPSEAIQQHPTKSFLSTIKAFYVVERLNDVFGIGRWNLTHKIVERTDDYILVSGRIILLDYACVVPVQYGGHTIIGTNTEIADGYKSAVTDLMSKSASYLHIGIDVFKGKVKSGKPPSSGNTPKGKKEQPTTSLSPSSTTSGVISEPQRKRLYAKYKESEMGEDDYRVFMKKFGYEHSKDIKKIDYDGMIFEVETFTKPTLDDKLTESDKSLGDENTELPL